jgi:16S rRNA (guanine966-N2)-methyltransferase
LSNPRIIAGKARGHRLQAVPGDITRPITDRVKEALFNILANDIQEAHFLDMFGGTGSVGIEALSRGAAYARFLDVHRSAVDTIKKNLSRTQLQGLADVVLTDAFQYLQRPPDHTFHYVYIAPPQYKQLWQKAIRTLDENPAWMAPDVWVIVQIDPLEYEAISLQSLHEFDQRRYGSTLLVFYEPTAEP